MPRKKLTPAFIESAKSDGKQVEYFDLLLPAFGIRIGAAKRQGYPIKSYFVMLRVDQPDGTRKLRRINLGRHGLVTLAEAREKARQAMREALEGKDPAKPRRRAEPKDMPVTFGQAAERYFFDHTRHLKRGDDVEAALRKHFDDWWSEPLKDFRRQDAALKVDRLAKEGKLTGAAALHQQIKSFFNWCADEEILQASPLQHYRLPTQLRSRPRERVLTSDEIRVFWAATADLDTPYQEFYRLLLLTGQRRSEVAGLRVDEIDYQDRLWRLPSDRNKSDRIHVVPLSDLSMDIIKVLPHYNEGPHLITSTFGVKPVAGFHKPKALLDKLIQLRVEADGSDAFAEPWRVHDLRRTMRTGLSMLGIRETVAERCLNHASRGLLKVYDQWTYIEEKRSAMQAWASHVEQLTIPTAESANGPEVAANGPVAPVKHDATNSSA